MSTSSSDQIISMREAVACGAATLVAYVGFVHEIVGAQLYPEGPAEFGGWVGWHGAGLFAIVAGVLLGAGALRRLPVPVVPLAVAVGIIGAAVFVKAALWQSSFHFFAFTLFVAAGMLILTERLGSASAPHSPQP